MADDKKIAVGKNGRAWRDLTKTVETLNPSRLTCLDAQGNVMRVIDLAKSDDDIDEPDPVLSKRESELQTFAKLVADAYDKASTAFQPMVTSAMGLVRDLSDALAKANVEIDKLRATNAKLVLQIGELTLPAAEGEDSIASALMQGMMTRQQQGRGGVPGVPNSAVRSLAGVQAKAAAKDGGK